MPVDLHQEAGSKILIVRAEGKLEKADYKNLVPKVEQMIQQKGKIRLLLELYNFHGWSAGALWEDVKFDIKHFNDIERLAIVGESRWQEGMAIFCKPFTAAQIRYFKQDQLSQAKEWIEQE
jgi:hypothetical protein